MAAGLSANWEQKIIRSATVEEIGWNNLKIIKKIKIRVWRVASKNDVAEEVRILFIWIARWVFRGSLCKLDSTQKLSMRGFRGHFPHSKTGIFKKNRRSRFWENPFLGTVPPAFTYE
jgi:hypothetical protein